VIPVDSVVGEGSVAATALGLLPTAALGEALRAALVDGALAPGPLALLGAWAVVLGLAARRYLRWD
jgi:ABC-2 type transport system permease protein